GDPDRASGAVKLAQPLLGWLGMSEGFEVLRVEERVEVLGRVVPEVHVNGVALNLVADAATLAVEVVLPPGHPRHGAALRDSLGGSERADGGQVGRRSTQPGTDDVCDPQLPLSVADEAD